MVCVVMVLDNFVCIIWVLLFFVFVNLVSEIKGYVFLIYFFVRKYVLDFLDNLRIIGFCGILKGIVLCCFFD